MLNIGRFRPWVAFAAGGRDGRGGLCFSYQKILGAFASPCSYRDNASAKQQIAGLRNRGSVLQMIQLHTNVADTLVDDVNSPDFLWGSRPCCLNTVLLECTRQRFWQTQNYLTESSAGARRCLVRAAVSRQPKNMAIAATASETQALHRA